MIRTSKHTNKFANLNKKERLDLFLLEYGKALQVCIDYFWNNEVIYKEKKKIKDSEESIEIIKTFNISKKQYECPKFITKEIENQFKLETPLSARALKCCFTQACGMIKAILEKPKRCEFVLAKHIAEGKDTTSILKRIAKLKITKPIANNVKAELNSICANLLFTESKFDGFIELCSLGKEFGKIRIPIKLHEQANKWKSQGKMMKSFLISNKFTEIRWEMPEVERVTEGEVVGVDQGMKDVATLSTEVVTPKVDIHNHSLESILHKLSRKKKGSKAFRKAQEHRKNFINYSINQLDFSKIKQINLEKVVNINYKRRSPRLLSHWTNTLIRDKFISKCEEVGVPLKLQSSTYRSQRCFNCGWVQKKNRKSGGKEFSCKLCGHHSDADLNAAKNHSIELPDVPSSLRKLKLNRNGFFWKPNGFSNLAGEKLTVSPSSK
jgi:hypothetical protein